MHKLSLGQPYHPNIKRWPEGVEYNYRGGMHELRMFFNHPSAEEVASVRRGHCRFALTVEQGVIFLLYRFEDAVPWGDAPYSIHLVPEAERQLPAATTTEHALLSVILVDASTGLVNAIRAVTFTPGFTQRLHAEICAQAVRPFSKTGHQAVINIIYEQFSTERLLERAVARSEGGM